MNEWMNEWNQWMNEINEWMNEWMNEINEWMNEWMNEGRKEWRNEGRKEWMNEGRNEWMNGWMMLEVMMNGSWRRWNVIHPQFDACFGPYRRSDPGLAPESQEFMFLHTKSFTQGSFYTQMSLHRAAFTHRCFYTQKHLQIYTSTQRTHGKRMGSTSRNSKLNCHHFSFFPRTQSLLQGTCETAIVLRTNLGRTRKMTDGSSEQSSAIGNIHSSSTWQYVIFR